MVGWFNQGAKNKYNKKMQEQQLGEWQGPPFINQKQKDDYMDDMRKLQTVKNAEEGVYTEQNQNSPAEEKIVPTQHISPHEPFGFQPWTPMPSLEQQQYQQQIQQQQQRQQDAQAQQQEQSYPKLSGVDLTPINPAMLQQGNQPDQPDEHAGLRGAINKFREIGSQVADNPGLWDAVTDLSQRIGKASQGSPYGLNSADLLNMGVQSLNDNLFGGSLNSDDIARIQQIMEAGYTKEQATDIYLKEKAEQEKLQEQRDYDLKQKGLAETAAKEREQKIITSGVDYYNSRNPNAKINADMVVPAQFSAGDRTKMREKIETATNQNHLYNELDVAIKELIKDDKGQYMDSWGTSGAIRDWSRNLVGRKNEQYEKVKSLIKQIAKTNLSMEPGAKTDFDQITQEAIEGDVLKFTSPQAALDWFSRVQSFHENRLYNMETTYGLAQRGLELLSGAGANSPRQQDANNTDNKTFDVSAETKTVFGS